MNKDVIYRKVYSDLTNEEDKDDIYTLSFNNNDEYKGEFVIKNLAIYYAFSIYCDITDGKFVFNESYIQSAYDAEYKKNRVELEKIHYYAEDLDDFISEFFKELSRLS